MKKNDEIEQKSPRLSDQCGAELPVVEDINDLVRVRLEKLEKLRNRNELAFKNGFEPTDRSSVLHREYDGNSREELEGNRVACSVAGRVMAIRHFGKAGFVRLMDRDGVIQLFVELKTLGEDEFAKYRELDVGDIVFSAGYLFKTKTNELSVHAERLVLLTKSLRPLPEKFHGLADVETRYRQRYLDLITNRQSLDIFVKRSRMIRIIREYFTELDYVEVETPMMQPIAGGAAARPFVTYHNALDMQLYLRIAPELYLKRLVVGGFDRVFEINRNFRNEGISIQHNPEFTMLEFYQAYATYRDLMPLTEELFRRVARAVCGSEKIQYQGVEIDLSGSWEKISVEDAVIKYSGFRDRSQLRNRDALLKYGVECGMPMQKKDPTGKLLMTIFEEEVEKKLIQPTFVTHFPLDVSPLARKNEQDPFLTDRFELMIYGREIANGFSELNDPIDQRERFLEQVRQKQAGDEEACDMDDDYVTALEYGLPPTAGEGIGIDRMVMLFTDAASIRDVILFPHMRKK